MTNTSRWAILGLVVVLALPVPALATHLSYYALNPVEHDDQGRVDEPDGASTSVLTTPATPLRNCFASLNLLPQCIPDAALPPKLNPAVQADVLAPGCSANDGRHVSGECGLYTVGVGHAQTGTVIAPGSDPSSPIAGQGTKGRTDGKAPGRLSDAPGTVIRFLDARMYETQVNPPAGGSVYFDYNHKLQDRGVSAALATVSPDLGGKFALPAGTAIWAFYGLWADLNANGVVDFLGTGSCGASLCGPDGGVKPTNEFRWVGRCVQFDGTQAPVGQAFCVKENLAMPVWIVPGNHHAVCFALTGTGSACGTNPAYWVDFPGRQATCLVDALGGNLQYPFCNTDLTRFDEFDQDTMGDPLLGPQDSVRIDGLMGDRSGDASDTGRQWVYQSGWATFFYDQSLAVTTTMIAGVTPQLSADTSTPTYFDVTKFVSVDVDSYRAWSPALNDLLQGVVKPTARGQWVLARDTLVPYSRAEFALLNNRVQYDACDAGGGSFGGLGVCVGAGPGPVTGQVDDTLQNAGYAHEPNTASDLYPGAVRGVCSAADGGSEATFRGYCNNYAAHVAGYRAWIDVNDNPSVFTSLAWRPPNPPGGNCVLCVTSGPTALPNLGVGHPRAAGNHDRALQPGTYTFNGFVGAWKDRAQPHATEYVLDVAATLATGTPQVILTPAYNAGPDSWVGDLLNNTGTTRDRGYAPVSCDIGGVVAVREWAQCDPYVGGNIQQPNAYSTTDRFGGEVCAAKSGVGGVVGTPWTVNLHPAGGVWTVPVLLWDHFDTWRIGDTTEIIDKTGSTQDIVIPAGDGGSTGGLATRMLLILPNGNANLPVTMTVGGTIVIQASTRCRALTETVRDVDEFVAYG